jgi:uncharacterized protein (DUF2384 family)
MDEVPSVAQIVSDLSTIYKDEGVVIWLTSPHRWLAGERAIDLLRTEEGRARVAAVVERLTSGAFS